ERLIVARRVGDRHAGSQVDAALPDDRRRPAEAGNALLPDDILVGTPLRRQAALGDSPLPCWPTELGPVLRRQVRGKSQTNNQGKRRPEHVLSLRTSQGGQNARVRLYGRLAHGAMSEPVVNDSGHLDFWSNKRICNIRELKSTFDRLINEARELTKARIFA